MASSFSASTAITDSSAASGSTDLGGWQRFLESQPLSVAALDAPENLVLAAPTDTAPDSLWQLLGQTLGSLSGGWTIGLLAGAVAAGNMTLLAFEQLVTLPAEPDCTDWTHLDSARDQLTCWQSAIAAGDAQARQVALAEVNSWPVSHPLFSEGQDLLEQWSHTALQEAQQAATDDNWATAIALVAQVPFHSSHFEDAQSLKAQLHTQQQGLAQTLNEQAQAALAIADWATAYQALSQLQELDHATAPLDLPQQLDRQITAEREATRLWNEAQRLWNSGLVVDRDTAIAIAHQIDTSTHRWQTIQPEVNRWSEEQITLAQTYTTPAITLIAQPQPISMPYQPSFSGERQSVQY